MCSVRVCVRAGSLRGRAEGAGRQAGRGDGAAKRRSAAARVTAPAIPDARHTVPEPRSGRASSCESLRSFASCRYGRQCERIPGLQSCGRCAASL